MNGAVLVAKMRCDGTKPQDARPEDAPVEDLRFSAVIDDGPENKEWSKWTPSGSVNLWVCNPAAHGKIEEGREYLVYFVPVQK